MTKDSLEELITSLTKSEKRYFRLFARMRGGKNALNFLRLFDCYTGSGRPAAEAAEKNFAGTPVLAHLRSVKSRLFDLVLKSQRTLYDGKNAFFSIQGIAADVEFLLAKRLYAPAAKRLKKAERLCLRFEYYSEALRLSGIQMHLFRLQPHTTQETFFRTMRENRASLQDLLMEQMEFLHLQEEMRGLVKAIPRPQTEGEFAAYHRLINHPRVVKPRAIRGARAGMLFDNLMGIFYLVSAQYAKAWRHFDHLMAYWKTDPDRAWEFPELYLSCYTNYLAACVHDKKWQAFETEVRAGRAERQLPAGHAIELFRLSYMRELNFMAIFGSFSEGDRLCREIESWLKKAGNAIAPGSVLLLLFNCCTFYFCFGKYSVANRYAIQILHFPAGVYRQDIREFTEVFQLILLYELESLDPDDHLLRAARRKFRDEKAGLRLESLLIELLIEVLKVPQGERRAVFESNGEAIEKLPAKSDGLAVLGIQTVRLWLRSKQAQAPVEKLYAEMLAENRRAAGL